MLNNDSNNNTTTTFDNNQTLTRQRRNKFLSFFPSSKLENNDILKNKWKPTDITTYHNSNRAQQEVCPTSNKSVNTSPTMTSSSSSSSTVCPSPIPTLTKPFFKMTNPCKPDYTMLQKYFSKFQNKPKHRSDILKLQLLPWLKKNTFNLRIQSSAEGDTCEENTLWGLKPPAKEKKELQFGRSVLLKWWRILLSSMLLIENEARSVYYESILEIISRCEFLDFDYVGPFEYTQWCSFSNNSRDNAINEYRQLLTVTLKYAFDRLNQRAIFSNMISFCSKILALCYFKIPGLASSLLEVLKLQPATMKKLKTEMTSKPLLLPLQYRQNLQTIFPPYLHQLMTPDMISYKHYFASLTKQRIRSPVNSSGNWVRRWKSDDSELFFSFYRHYHSTLKSYIAVLDPTINTQQIYQRNAILMVSPGYMYFASFFAGKIDSLINREINSVTTAVDQQLTIKGIKTNSFLSSTIAPVDNISMIDDSKPFMGAYNDPTAKAHCNTLTGKPKALEMATRRYAECMTWCVIAADPIGLYHDMVNVWMRLAIKRTVLTEAEGVYCLLDFIEQTVLELQKFPLKRNYFPIDLPFILHMLDIILSRSDHTITILRALSFIYINFGFLTSHAALLDMLCNRIMLDTVIFERLLLHWCKTVRVFYLRCLMWRVGRVWHNAGIRWNSEAEHMVKIMVRENKEEAICDGHTCWTQWNNRSSEELFSDLHSEIKAYRQCSLEIHIVLETLMASFHRSHSYFQQLFLNAPNRQKLMHTTSVTADECLTSISKRSREFSSQLAIPSIDHNLLPASFSTFIGYDDSDRNSDSNNSTGNGYKKSRSSPNFKKKYLISRSRAGKGRFSKLFHSNASLSPSCKITIDEDITMTGANDELGIVNDASTLNLNEFYTIPGNYTVSSILSADDNNSFQENNRHQFQTTHSNGIKLENIKNSNDERSPDILLFKQNYQICSLSKIPKPVCLMAQKPLQEITCYSQQKDLNTKNSLNEFHSDVVKYAISWKYHPSRHVYAPKILSEMKVIMHEYCVWLEKNQELKSNSSMIFVPHLSLDWPKNWTVSLCN